MSEKNTSKQPQGIPLEIGDKAAAAIDLAFQVVKERLSEVSAADRAFEAKKTEAEKRIKNGARRTSGRIV
jgi:hypothetical protein